MSDTPGEPKHGQSQGSTPPRVCLVSTVPSTLEVFYQPLLAGLVRAGARVTLISSAGSELDCLAEAHGVDVYPVTITRRISPLKDLSAILRLRRFLRSRRFDLMHTHTPKAGFVGMVAGWLARVPVRVHTLHGLPLETTGGIKRWLLTVADRLTHRLAHKVCVVSRSLCDRAIALRLCHPDKMLILGDGTACGVDLSRFRRSDTVVQKARHIREQHGISAEAVVIGFVGWLVADKGVTELVDVFTDLARRRDDLHLLMIGADGGERDPLPTRTLDAIREHPRITHAGLVSDPVPYYAAMDVCVLPTRREGFPYAVLEAAALEVPTIATRVTGCMDAVVDGETGILIDPSSASALGDAIERLIGNEALRHKMGKAAGRRVRESFGSDRLVAEHLSLYAAEAPWCRWEESRTIARD